MFGDTTHIHVVWQKTWRSQAKVRLAIDKSMHLSIINPQIVGTYYIALAEF